MEQSFELGLTLTAEEMQLLKGGKADVKSQSPETSQSGDGAKFACCVEIEF